MGQLKFQSANSEANGLYIGDGTDGIVHYVSGGVPFEKVKGSNSLVLESDDANQIIFFVREDDTHYLRLEWSKAGNVSYIISTSTIRMNPNLDTNDYWYFSTSSNIASMLPNEDKVHCIGSAALSADHVYSDDFDNTSPFEEFEDPLTDLKNIKSNTEKTKLDYTSLPNFVRSHTRDPSKHVWGKKTVIEEVYNEETEEYEEKEVEKDYIIERAPKDVIEDEGFSINRMVVFLYQCLQKQQDEIELLNEELDQLKSQPKQV